MKYLYLLILIGFAFMIIDSVQGSEDLSWMIGHEVEFAYSESSSHLYMHDGIVIDVSENGFVLIEYDFGILRPDIRRKWIQSNWITSMHDPRTEQ